MLHAHVCRSATLLCCASSGCRVNAGRGRVRLCSQSGQKYGVVERRGHASFRPLALASAKSWTAHTLLYATSLAIHTNHPIRCVRPQHRKSIVCANRRPHERLSPASSAPLTSFATMWSASSTATRGRFRLRTPTAQATTSAWPARRRYSAIRWRLLSSTCAA